MIRKILLFAMLGVFCPKSNAEYDIGLLMTNLSDGSKAFIYRDLRGTDGKKYFISLAWSFDSGRDQSLISQETIERIQIDDLIKIHLIYIVRNASESVDPFPEFYATTIKKRLDSCRADFLRDRMQKHLQSVKAFPFNITIRLNDSAFVMMECIFDLTDFSFKVQKVTHTGRDGAKDLSQSGAFQDVMQALFKIENFERITDLYVELTQIKEFIANIVIDLQRFYGIDMTKQYRGMCRDINSIEYNIYPSIRLRQ